MNSKGMKSLYEYDKCYETNTPLKPGTKIVSMVRNRSIRGVQIEVHSTFFTTKNESKFVLLTTIFTTNGLVSYYLITIETIFVPGWICFVPLKLFLYETDPFVCFFVFVVYNLNHTVHFSQPKMSQNLYCVPLVAHHEWICFVLLKLFLYFFIRILRIL